MPLPLPLPLGSSKHETKKSQSSKIVPSDHGQSEKSGEKYQAKIFSSSPQGPLKKRSALEDLTNASQSQPAQPKKEASKEFVKDVSKKINRTKPTLELAKNNEMNIRQYELDPSSSTVSTPMVLHIVKKPRFLKTSTISETPTTEEPSLIKKPLVLKEKPTTGGTVLKRRSLSLKRHIDQNNISLFEKPLTLLEETESDLEYILEPVTFGKKQKTEEAVVTQRNLSFKEMCTCQGKQSCCEEEMTLLNINVEKDSFFMKPMNMRKKPETEEASPTKQLLTLNKSATQEKMSHEKRSLILQKATSGEELLIEKKCTTEEFHFQESSLLQQKHTTQGEVSILKKPLTLQKTTTKEELLLKRTLFLKKKRTIEEAAATKELVVLKKKCITQDKISCLKTISEAKSVIKEPLSFEKKPTTEEELLFKESSVLPEKHTTQGEVALLKKPLVLQKTPTEEESLFKETLGFKKKRTIEEAAATKELVVLKKKCTTQDKIPCLKKPLALQTISEGKSVLKEPLSFKKKPATEKEFLFKESSVLPEKHTTQREVALLKKPWALQENIHSKDEFLMEAVSFRKKHTTNEAISSKELISLKKKERTTQIMMSICQVMLDLQNIIDKGKDPFFMGPASLRKKSSVEEAVLTKTPLSAKRKQLTQGKMFLLEKPLVLDKTTSEKGSLFKKALLFKEKPKTNKEFLCQDPSLLKEDHTTLQGMFHSKKPLALQEKTTTKEKSYIKEPSEKKPITEEEFLFQEPFSLHVKPTNKDKTLFCKCLNRQNKMDTKEDSLKKPLTLQEKSTTEKDSLFKKPLVLKKKQLSSEATASIESQLLKKKPTAQGEMFLLKKQLSLQKNITNEEFLIKQPLTLQEKPGIEKESLLKELAFHGKSTINEALHFKMFSLNEKPTTEQELSFEEPLALQNNPTHREDTFLKDVSIHVESSPHVFSAASESRIGMSSSGLMSIVSKFNTTKKSCACESSSNKPFSSCGKRSQKEITPLEDFGKNHNSIIFDSIYVKDIFRYLKEREEKFILKKYMCCQRDISSNMRAVLVNWLVAVQVTFKVSHETLYLAVKLVDHYLMKVMCKKDKLQLLGSTAFMIAAKFEESCPPRLDDFLYICNGAYQRDEMLSMEISILKTLKFDINIPVAYHFLRRYSVCFRVNMNTLLLSRFICEMTLVEYDYIQESASKLAAGSFLLALYMKNLGHLAPTLEYYSGYKTSDLHPLVKKLNVLLTLRSCDNRLKAVPSKYSHRLFFEVTKIPPLNMWNLEEILNSC